MLSPASPYSVSECYYWKNDFGEVSFSLQFSATEELGNNTTVCHLPVGFRPAKYTPFPAVMHVNGAARREIMNIYAQPTGEVMVDFFGGVSGSGSIWWCNGTFLAGE